VTSASKGNNRILIVDDEAGLRTSLAANLELEGYEVVEAGGGAGAVELVREAPFDLVISDVRMPGMSGIDVFREIRRIRHEIPVILMTGFTAEKLLAEALGEGVFAVLSKPVAVDQLIALIARVIAGPIVLVVDDVVDQAMSVVEALRALGIDARATYDGESAVRLARTENVDVCVIDLVMPGMDGVQTCEELRRVDPSISVIAVSGHSVPGMMHALMSMGGYACLRKPFHMPELTRAIARARGEARR
jgi:two-component system, NtrC family, response regulator HydG